MHDLAERETTCADGMCPLCMATEIERLKETISCQTSEITEQWAVIKRLRAELEHEWS